MRKIISLFLIFLLLLTFCTTAFSYELPESIRVGLFYGSGSKSEYTVSAAFGVEITGGGGTYITKDSAATEVTIAKDSFYHGAVDGKFSTADEAWAAVSTLKQNGTEAFFVLDGSGFSVYSGKYETENEANTAAEQISACGFNSRIVSPSHFGVLVLINGSLWTGSVSSGIRIIPLDGNAKIDSKEYRGYYEFYRDEKSDMAAVNVVGIEEYLMGVVPKEVSASWHAEAVKAQAIVARTYAITNMTKFKSYGFNVDNTASSQVYGGVSAEHELSNDAVLKTAGKLVMYEGNPAEVFFFSSSGGMTESVENVWGGTPRPYLVSVEDSYENPIEASYSSWNITLSPEKVAEKLLNAGVDVGEVTDITLDETTAAGRSLKTTVHGTNGSHTLTFEKARTTLGLYSNMFTISREGGENPAVAVLIGNETKSLSPEGLTVQSVDGKKTLNGSVSVIGSNSSKTYTKTNGTGNFIISGKGWGHGIGMSQWGAKGMAEAGFSAEEIITHYFKGTEVY